jgi:hypothetical protein
VLIAGLDRSPLVQPGNESTREKHVDLPLREVLPAA